MAIGPGPLGSRLHGRKRAAAAWWNVDFRNSLADLTIVFRHVAGAEAALQRQREGRAFTFRSMPLK